MKIKLSALISAVSLACALCAFPPAAAAFEFAAGDVDRDGYDDLALIGNGEWFAWMSGANYAMRGPFDLQLCGGSYTLGDLDGDRQPDLAMLSGLNWYAWLSASDYNRRGPFGFNPGASTNIIPIAYSLSFGSPVQYRHYIGFMLNGWLHQRWLDDMSKYIAPIELAQGVPVFGRFDGHQGPDLLVVERLADSFRLYSFLSEDKWEKRGPYSLRSGNAPGVAAMVWQDTNGCYAAASVYDIGDITNALVTVNGTPLVYDRKLAFTNSAGRPLTLQLPMYYAALTNVQSGTPVVLSVHTNGPSGPVLMYRSAPTAMPEQTLLIEPANGARVLVNAPVPMSWTAASEARGYLVTYQGPDDYTPQWDGGWHANYLAAPATTYTIPAGCAITGHAEFAVAALNGDVQLLTGAEDTNDCFLVVGSWDETETTVDIPVSDPLFIAREYSLKEEGLRFHARESDPYKMPHPGTVTVHLKLRRWKLSVAFVAAYDMNGQRYFMWDKARIFKRKNKNYSVTFAAQPGSTIVIGTHNASYQGASYVH